MFKSVPLFVGLRYVRAKRRNHFISFISMISMIGIGLGVLILIVVLSVMNGFQQEIKKRLLGMEAHLTVSAFGGDWRQAIKKLKQIPEVTGAAPVIEGFGLANRGRHSRGVQIRGIDPKQIGQVSGIAEHMICGSLDALDKTRFGVVLGYEVATGLTSNYQRHFIRSIKRRFDHRKKKTGNGRGKVQSCGDFNVLLIVPEFRTTIAGSLPRYKRFKVVGIFNINMTQYDSNMVLINIKDAAKLYRGKNKLVNVQVRLDDMFKAHALRSRIIRVLNTPHVYNWERLHQNLFSAMRFEKRMMSFLLSLIIVVAAINIISTLVMVVTDKKTDIAILRTLGAAPATIKNIFIVQGLVVGVIGTLFGLGLGLLIAYNVESIIAWFENLVGAEVLSPDVYYITKIVGVIQWWQVAVISAGAVFISLLATLYPAYSAARTQPAEALRYE